MLGCQRALFDIPHDISYLNAAGWSPLPLATMARPSDHRYACSAVHSDLLVGLESGKMIGRGLSRDIAFTTASVNVPG